MSDGQNEQCIKDVECSVCHKKDKVQLDNFTYSFFTDKPYPWKCPECSAKEAAEQAAKEAEEERQRKENLFPDVEYAGVKPRYIRKNPDPDFRYIPFWIWQQMFKRGANLLISGETGTGKSTAVGVVIWHLVELGLRSKCWYMPELLDEWRCARQNNNDPYAVKDLFERIEKPQYVFIDECADKCVMSPSTQEFMFRLLEDIYNGTCKAKVCLLGNFYKGSIRDIFGDEAPATRRLRETFYCYRTDRNSQTMIPYFDNTQQYKEKKR